jgi:hypothetical protein
MQTTDHIVPEESCMLSFAKHEHHKHVDSNVSHNTIRPSAMFDCESFAIANIESLVHILDMVLLKGNQRLQVLQFRFMMDPQSMLPESLNFVRSFLWALKLEGALLYGVLLRC